MRSRTLLVVLGWVASLVVAAALGWWAGGVVTTPPAAQQPSAEPIIVPVSHASVKLEQSYPVTATWQVEPVANNTAVGTLTSVADGLEAGMLVEPGDVVYSVDLVPVVALTGDVPAFRALTSGATGPDVAQLNDFLHQQGYLEDSPHDRFDVATQEAVTRWGNDLDVDLSQGVPQGMLVFVPSLPRQLVLAPELNPGDLVSAGQNLLMAAASEPTFTMNVLPEAIERFQPGVGVVIEGPSPWQAQISRLETSQDSSDATVAVLTPARGETICGDDCLDAVPLGGESVLGAVVTLVPESSGPSLPVSAIWTDASGNSCVTLADGTPTRVEQIAAADGRAVVAGVEVGQQVEAVPGPEPRTC